MGQHHYDEGTEEDEIEMMRKVVEKIIEVELFLECIDFVLRQWHFRLMNH